MVALAELALGSLVHTYLIGAALSPLRRLEETAHRVEAGDMDARADTSPLADREMVRLVRVFNLMLDTLASLSRKERARSACTLKALENRRFRTARDVLETIGQTPGGWARGEGRRGKEFARLASNLARAEGAEARR